MGSKKQNTFEQVLASRQSRETPLTTAQRELIVREHTARMQQHHSLAVDDAVDNVLGPWLACVNEARALHPGDSLEGLEKVREQVKKRAARTTPVLRAPPGGDQLLIPRPCLLQWSPAPTFEDGHPTDEVTTDTISPETGGPGKYKATSSYAVPDHGLLSLGAGVGRGPLTLDVYPGEVGTYYTRNQAGAFLWRFEEFPPKLTDDQGLLTSAKHVEVTVGATVKGGLTSTKRAHTWLDPVKGPDEDSPVQGVLVLGALHLYLFGSPGVIAGGLIGARDLRFFLLEVESETNGVEVIAPADEVVLVESLALGPGAAGITVFVGASVTAVAYLKQDDIKMGFAGIDVRIPLKTHQIWACETGGGPIEITRLSFCCRPCLQVPSVEKLT